VRLRDGHFREPAAPGSATEVRVWLLDQVVRWTVDTFYELVVVEARARRPVQVASAELGDRVRVQSLTVERGTGPPAIRATLVVHGPDDPLCCPTRLTVRSFVWRDGALVPPE
jgi:hypothetical protein